MFSILSNEQKQYLLTYMIIVQYHMLKKKGRNKKLRARVFSSLKDLKKQNLLR